MSAIRSSQKAGRVTGFAALLFLAGALIIGCDDDEGGQEATGPTEPPPALSIEAFTDADSVWMTWTPVSGARYYRAEIRTNPETESKKLPADADRAVFRLVKDGVTHEAQVFAVNVAGASGSNTVALDVDHFPWDENFPTALHVTAQGMQTFYDLNPNDGFERFTNIPYADLRCKNCHEPSATGGCGACHRIPVPILGSTVDASLSGPCGTCHGRQKAEVAHGFSDVHRDAGMGCMDCHTMEDMHGDGTTYPSMLAEGAIDASCEDCHTSLASNQAHDLHADDVDCSACHVQSVVTCYNCHFESEINDGVKRAIGQVTNWVFLLNRDGKVHTGNFQSVKYQNHTMVGLAPYYAHTIARNARSCGDCHNSAALAQYLSTGSIDVATWNGSSFTYAQGVVPVPPDYETALNFDFADYDPNTQTWSFLKSGADAIQLLFGEPMTQEQMDKLDAN